MRQGYEKVCLSTWQVVAQCRYWGLTGQTTTMIRLAFGALGERWRFTAALVGLALAVASCSSGQVDSAGQDTATQEIEIIENTTTAAPAPDATVARQAGEPSTLSRTAGEPATGDAPSSAAASNGTPLVHVLGSIRSIEDETTDFSEGVPPLLSDLATIASVGCSPTECPATAVATWAEGTLEIVNVATRSAASEGTGPLGTYVGDLQREGVAVIGYGATLEDATRPIVFTNGEEEIAIFAMSLDPGNQAIATADTPGVAGVEAIESVQELIEANRNSGRGVVVLVDWGDTDERSPSADQTESVAQIAEAGADAIIGHGSDFLQRFDLVDQTAVAYNLGNSSISTTEPLRADTAVLRLEFDSPGRSCLLPATAGPSGPALDLPDNVDCAQ